jgi:hypothetical protein
MGTVGILISPRLASATARMRGPRMHGLDERGTANASASYRRGRYSPRLGLLDGPCCCCPTGTRTRTRRAWGTWQKAASVIIVFVIVFLIIVVVVAGLAGTQAFLGCVSFTTPAPSPYMPVRDLGTCGVANDRESDPGRR